MSAFAAVQDDSIRPTRNRGLPRSLEQLEKLRRNLHVALLRNDA
jgi:hypothetical protein